MVAPIIHMNGKSRSLEETFAFLEECGKFEKRCDPLISNFCNYLTKSGLTKKSIKDYNLACQNFIGFLGMYCGVSDLSEVTKAQVGNKYLRHINKGITSKKYDDRYVLKEFFIYLHQVEKLTNTKVLRALCSPAELKTIHL